MGLTVTEEKTLYRDGKTYDAMNDRLIVDTHFYVNELKDIQGPILELACGTGRITCVIAQAGKTITGLDFSKAMLTQAQEKSQTLKLNIDWVHGDMTEFNLNKKFDVIFVGYNSVHHIQTNQQLESFLTCVKKHLNPGGRFMFDIFNPSLELLNRHKIRSEMDNYIDPQTGEEIFVTEENEYDAATQINHVTYFYSKAGTPDFHSHPLDMRMYFPQEMEAHLKYHGFKIVKKFGDFDKAPFSKKSMRQICECVQT